MVGQSRAAKVLALIASGMMFLSALPAPSEARITVSEAGDVLVGPPRVIDGDTLVVCYCHPLSADSPLVCPHEHGLVIHLWGSRWTACLNRMQGLHAR